MDHEFRFLFSLFILIMFWFQTARDCWSLSLSGCRLHFFLAKICQKEPHLLKFSQKAAQLILTGCKLNKVNFIKIKSQWKSDLRSAEHAAWRCYAGRRVTWCCDVIKFKDQQFEKRKKEKKNKKMSFSWDRTPPPIMLCSIVLLTVIKLLLIVFHTCCYLLCKCFV